MKVTIFNKIIFENKTKPLMTFIEMEVVESSNMKLLEGKAHMFNQKGNHFGKRFILLLL